MYSATFEGVAVTVQQDFFEVNCPSDAVVRIHEVHITNGSDVDSEQIRIAIKRGATVSGSGGTTPTPGALSFGDVAFGGTVEANNTTKANTGTIVTLHAEGVNILNGFHYIPTPESRIDLSPSQRLTVELLTTPVDSISMSGTIIFEEIGG
jgi:hypothetical protein